MGCRSAAFALMCTWSVSALAQGVTVVSTGVVHPTIGQAVQAAVPGDTLRVSPGVYAETVQVDRDLVIEGAGAGQVTITGGQGVIVEVAPGVDVTLRDLALSSASRRALTASLGATVRLERVDLDAAGGGNGGAVALTEADLVGVDVRFLGVAPAVLGGALHAYGSGGRQVDLTRATFSMQGHASHRGGAVYTLGVAFRCVDCAFDDAVADDLGGAVYAAGPVELVGGTFQGCSAQSGGAVYVDGARLDVADTRFVDNSALLQGGGVKVHAGTDLEIVRALFCDNTADDGGGFHGEVANGGRIASSRFVENSGTTGGAAIVSGAGSWSLENLSVLGNNSGPTGAIHIRDTAVSVVNSLFSENLGYAMDRAGNFPPQIHSPAFHSNSLGHLQNANVASGGMFDIDPLLVSYLHDGDCTNDDLWPSPVSPLIDAGNADPAWRDPDGSRGDIGAYGGPDADPSRHLTDDDGDNHPLVRDCDDADPLVYAGADELCNLTDDDCDGDVDEDAVDRAHWYPDADGDGFGDWSAGAGVLACFAPDGWVQDWTDCDDGDPGIHPDALEVCNALDLNCDGDPHLGAVDAVTWSLDGDGDGHGQIGTGVVACTNPHPGLYTAAPDDDCADATAAIHPGQDELCDGVDDNCSGDESDALNPTAWHLDADGDGHGALGAPPTMACTAPPGTSATADDCHDARADVFPGAPELCDGLDNDCDDVIDDGGEPVAWFPDGDGDGFGAEGRDVSSWCPPEPEGWVEGQGGDCDDAEPEVFPGAPEACDALDNDCDGLVDDEDPDVKGSLAWTDADGDGFGAGPGGLVCDMEGRAPRDGDCNDHDPAIHPDADEILDNDLDEDCDGRADVSGAPGPRGLESQPGGCACASTGGPGAGAWPLLLLALWLARRGPRRLLLGGAALAACAPSEPPPEAPAPPDLAAILADVEARVHRVRGLPVDGVDEAWQVLAPGVRAWFLDDGRVVARPRRDDGSWRVDLRFEGWGREGDRAPAPLRDTVVDGHRLEHVRDGVTEWYVGRGDAIEQGFTLRERPDGRGPVEIALAVEGADRALLHDGAVSFLSGGRHRLRYADLEVVDADGRALPSRMALEGCEGPDAPCAVLLRFDDEGARWPVAVDPLMTSLETATPGGPQGLGGSGATGASVDLDGNWAIVGMPGTGPDGRAVILQRDRQYDIGGWHVVTALERPWTVDFGAAVAIEYPYAAVGAPGSDEVHVYEAVDPETWLHAATVRHHALSPAEFGAALDLSPEILVIGDPGQAGGGEVQVHAVPHPGAAAAPWSHLATYTLGVAQPGARFGGVVAVDGHRFAVGAPGSARVAVHERDPAAGASWPRKNLLQSFGDFGRAIALDGEWMVVAGGPVPLNLFRRRDDAQGWLHEAAIPDPVAPGPDLGVAVALDGARVLAAARHGAATVLHVWERDRSQPGTVAYVETFEVGRDWALRPPALAAHDGTYLVGLPDEPAAGAVAFYEAAADSIVPWGVAVHGVASAHTVGSAAGAAVAVEGDFVFVGAPDSDLYGFRAGAVTQIARLPQRWEFVGALAPPFPLPHPGAAFGARLALDDGRLLVGAPGVDAATTDAGAAYLYRRASLPYSWVLWRTFTDPAAGPGQRFGASVALEHDLAAIGAPGEREVVTYEAGAPGPAPSWNEVGRVASATADGFGEAVALDAPFLAVGAPLDDDFGQDAGSVRIYRWDAGVASWWPDATLGSGASAGAELGRSVALEGGRLAAGAPGANGGNGAAWLWTDSGPTGWRRLGTVTPPGARAGSAVALEGTDLYVGAPGSEEVYLYDLTAGSQLPGPTLVVQPAAGAVGFGASVAVESELLVVGAPGTAAQTGGAHVFLREAELPPVALGDQLVVLEDVPKLVAVQDLLANDWDPGGQPLQLGAVTAPEHGAVEVLGANLRYTPAPDHHGVDTFTYTVSDGTTESSPATVTLQIQPVDDPCEAVPDGPYQVLEDHTLVAPESVLANDVDPDHGGPHPGITGWMTLPPAHGQLTFNGGAFVYQPAPDFHGPDGFTYVCADALGGVSDALYVPIEVLPVPDAPTVTAPAPLQVDEDATLAVPPPGLLAGAQDVDGDVLEAQLVTPPQHGVVTVRPNGSFDYTPAPGVSGVQDGFTFRAWDGELASVPVVVAITLVPHDDPPVGVPDAYVGTEDVALQVPAGQGVLANDADDEGAPLTAQLLTQPANGALTLLSNGSFTYTPDPDFSGVDGFTYEARDATGASAPTVVQIEIREVDDPPWAADDAYAWDPVDGLEVAPDRGVLLNDGDPEGAPIAVHAVVKRPTWGELTLDPEGSFVYRPEPGFEGRDTFTYVVTDGASASLPALVEIEVRDNPPADTGDGSGSKGCATRRFLLDRDGDGWGDDAHAIEACEADALLAERGGDCDDADASIHPGAREVAQDGVDQDCDGDDAVVEPLAACSTGGRPVGGALVVLALAALRRREGSC